MESNSANLTPMMRQYLDIKKNYQDSILFFRLGDFYEMFFEDAVTASNLLEIALTSRNKSNENSVPLCGVPYHSASSYIAKLIQMGHKVAICEQVEDPQSAKGIVRREVTRVVTPGVVLETESLEARGNNYLLSLTLHQNQTGLAYADISTGEVSVALFLDIEDLFSHLLRLEPREILASPQDREHPIIQKIQRQFPRTLVHFSEIKSENDSLLESFPSSFKKSWEILDLKRSAPLVERAGLRLLHYIQQTLKTDLNHLTEIHWKKEGGFLTLDATTLRNLELIRNLQDGGHYGTLFQVLDQSKTVMGSRRLKQWILYPLADVGLIQQRQEGIRELIEQSESLEKIREALSCVMDLERLNSRIATSMAHARDLIALGSSLQKLPSIQQELQKLNAAFFKNLLGDWKNLEAAAEKIMNTLKADAPLSLREGGLICDGVIPDLDELRSILQDGKGMLAKMEEDERRKTGISTLKVRYNRVFGYYIEVSSAKADAVPAHYIRKQTLVNAERYITPELKLFEDKVLGAEERIRLLEYDYFIQLRLELIELSPIIALMAKKISELDVLCALSLVAQENNYVCPQFVTGQDLKMIEGRHPVLEKLFPSNRFVPNDVMLSQEESRFILITGPNMAGKSTILRQTALIALMAHMGSFVPAKSLEIGLLDRIFTRIGASDNLSKNQSTFWVEMEETAHILKSATQKSLIVLDEIGRGTSTYDGLSVAWAVTEYLHDQIQAKTLFATHYHELISLADTRSSLKNYHIAVKEWKGQIHFLYHMIPGGTSRSYGIQVAALAGIPDWVIHRAQSVLADLEAHPSTHFSPSVATQTNQMSLFDAQEKALREEIDSLDLNQVSPLQALQILYDLQKKK
ncbi:MAG: DNA mismatch repair protein MutS [Deltaproteobacteria bacterium]|nr:DNA mismatch repair protein MutS [Deltaproteobacteria bacterium]